MNVKQQKHKQFLENVNVWLMQLLVYQIYLLNPWFDFSMFSYTVKSDFKILRHLNIPPEKERINT